jgi:hypothetical protein
MLLIQQVTTAPLQKQVLVLQDGTTISLELYYRPQQNGWFVNELVYGDFTLRGLRISNSPNMLNQWRNLLPFGFACFSAANREPTQQEDFSSGASKLYILTEAEVAAYAEFLSAG